MTAEEHLIRLRTPDDDFASIVGPPATDDSVIP